MANKEWVVSVVTPRAQVAQKHIGSTTNGQTFTISLKYEDNVSVTVLTHVVDGVDAGSDTAIAQEIVDEYNLLTHELAIPVTATRSGAVVILTADAAGRPFYAGYGGTGTWDNTGATNTANIGPSDLNDANNFSDGVVLANGDSFLAGPRGRASPILYGLYQSGLALAQGDFPYGGPEIGTPRFPMTIGVTKGVVGAIFGGTGGLTPASCQHFNVGSGASKWEVLATNTAGTSGFPPLMITGTHASGNVLSVTGNSFVGWGLLPYGTTSVCSTIVNAGSGFVAIGAGTTTATVTNSGTGTTILNGGTNYTVYAKSGLTICNAGSGLRFQMLSGSATVQVNTRGGAPDVALISSTGGGVVDFTADARSFIATDIVGEWGDLIVKVASDSQYLITNGVSFNPGASVRFV